MIKGFKRFIAWFKREWDLYLREFCEGSYRIISLFFTGWTFFLLMAALQYVINSGAGSLFYYLWCVVAVAWLWYLISVWRKFHEFLKR
jgi:hypothetical protein